MDKNTIKLFGSRKTDNWQTPKDLIEELKKEFNFTLDPCPLHPLTDGLEIPWKGNVFVNPPYSQISKWLEKAHEELKKGNPEVIVFLTFANTDTRWFHDLIYGQAELRFIKGRIKFLDENGEEQNSAMRPSMLAIFRIRNKLRNGKILKVKKPQKKV